MQYTCTHAENSEGKLKMVLVKSRRKLLGEV